MEKRIERRRRTFLSKFRSVAYSAISLYSYVYVLVHEYVSSFSVVYLRKIRTGTPTNEYEYVRYYLDNTEILISSH